MSVNPDKADSTYAGAIVPSQGDLRFVEREVTDEASGLAGVHRILQRYEWSYSVGNFGWYDIPIDSEEVSTQ